MIVLCILMMVVLTFMLMTTCTRTGGFVTANVTSHGPLHQWLQTVPGRRVVAIQEHHITVDKLAGQQSKLADLGRKGLWTPAAVTQK